MIIHLYVVWRNQNPPPEEWQGTKHQRNRYRLSPKDARKIVRYYPVLLSLSSTTRFLLVAKEMISFFYTVI